MMVIKSQVLIRTPYWQVFNCITNPFQKCRWMSNMVDSTFYADETDIAGGKPFCFKEVMQQGETIYTQQVQLLSYRKGHHVELNYLLKSHDLIKKYHVIPVGKYTILELVFNVQFKRSRSLNNVAWFFMRGSMQRKLTAELEAIKNTLDSSMAMAS